VNGTTDRLGVLLMTYGSPSSLEDVPRYLAAVRGGREPAPDLVAEFRRRYQVIGGSPLIPITQAQAAALEERLGGEAIVRAAMRFSPPTIVEALRDLINNGVVETVGVVMSPQYSDLLMGGYRRAVDSACDEVGWPKSRLTVAGAWHTDPAFVQAIAERVRSARVDEHVLLTAHSLPRRVVDQEPEYIDQLRETAQLVAARAGLGRGQWSFCWQSAGHEPGEWMKPDFADLMPQLAADGSRAVLVAPVQFLADHLEVLYDIDIGAREQAQSCGLEFARIQSLNADPLLIEALGNAVRHAARGITNAGRPASP
jgi:ferrochelatase